MKKPTKIFKKERNVQFESVSAYRFNPDFSLGMLVSAKKLEGSFVSDDEGHALCGMVEELEDKNVPRFFDDGSIPNAKSGFNSTHALRPEPAQALT